MLKVGPGPSALCQKKNKACSATFSAAAGGGLFPLDPGLDDIRGAADTGRNTDGAGHTILGTCATLHASIKINDFGFSTVHSKYRVRADAFTNTAANARFWIKLQCCYPFYISKVFHFAAYCCLFNNCYLDFARVGGFHMQGT